MTRVTQKEGCADERERRASRANSDSAFRNSANEKNQPRVDRHLRAESTKIGILSRSFDRENVCDFAFRAVVRLSISTFVRARRGKSAVGEPERRVGSWRADAAAFFVVFRFAPSEKRVKRMRELDGRDGRGAASSTAWACSSRCGRHNHITHLYIFPGIPWPPRARSLGAQRATRRSNGRRTRLLRLLRLGRFLLLLSRGRAAALGRGLGLGLVR